MHPCTTSTLLMRLVPRSPLITTRESVAMFDRSDDEWDAMIADTVTMLEDQARLKRVTSYSDVNSALARRGHRPFDFANQSDRTAMGALLGDVVKRTIGASGIMLSAIVAYIDRNGAGPGFYSAAVELGLLPNTANADDKLVFWAGQVAKVHDRYARPPRRRGQPSNV
jgi:hypothetical protein